MSAIVVEDASSPAPLDDYVPSKGDIATKSAAYQAGYARGVDEAKREIEGRRAQIYVYGTRSSLDILDRATGLDQIDLAGCFVDDETKGRAAGHNEYVLNFVARYGAPIYSRKRWERELFDLEAYFASRPSTDVSKLPVDGTNVRLGGGRVLVSGRPFLRVTVDGTPVTRRLADGRSSMTIDVALLELPKRGEVTLGPEESDTLIFRWGFDGSSELAALDLRTGEWLRHENGGPVP
jgi:hypothetical protein